MASGAPSAPPEQPWLEPVSQAIAAPLHERLRAGQRHLSGSVAQLALDGPSERVLTERVATELEQIAEAATPFSPREKVVGAPCWQRQGAV